MGTREKLMAYVASSLEYLATRPKWIPTLDGQPARNHNNGGLRELLVEEEHVQRTIHRLLDDLLDALEAGRERKARRFCDRIDARLLQLHRLWMTLETKEK